MKINIAKWKMENHSFTCIFQEFQYLIGFTLSVGNPTKCWRNRIKKIMEDIGKNARKKENRKTLKF